MKESNLFVRWRIIRGQSDKTGPNRPSGYKYKRAPGSRSLFRPTTTATKCSIRIRIQSVPILGRESRQVHPNPEICLVPGYRTCAERQHALLSSPTQADLSSYPIGHTPYQSKPVATHSCAPKLAHHTRECESQLIAPPVKVDAVSTRDEVANTPSIKYQ